MVLAGHTHRATDPLAVGRLDRALVPEMLNMQKIVTEMDACGVHHNDGAPQGNDAAVAGQDTIPVAEPVNEGLLEERAANGEAIDAKELN